MRGSVREYPGRRALEEAEEAEEEKGWQGAREEDDGVEGGERQPTSVEEILAMGIREPDREGCRETGTTLVEEEGSERVACWKHG